MKALVTGAKGFIGKNLVVALRRADIEVAEIDVDSSQDAVADSLRGTDVVFHLAGVNRPEHEREFETGNVGSLDALFSAMDDALPAGSKRPLVVLSSSKQAECDNPYGRSKRASEESLRAYASRSGAPAVIYRLPGVFGKWCRPHYNSVVATFCHCIARDLPVTIDDPNRVIELVHVDDVVAQFMTHLGHESAGTREETVRPTFTVGLKELADTIRGFRASRGTLHLADVSDPFTRRLLGTYTSYLEPDDLTYSLQQRVDARGTLAELLKSPRIGQIFVSRTNPGFTRGNHYHDLKVEKFCVLEGDAIIRFRSILGEEVIEHRVSGTEFRVVDIPPGMTHSIENAGKTEMVVMFWSSEIYDPEVPDAYYIDVIRG